MIILVGLISGILGIAAFGSALLRWYRGTPTAVTVTNSEALNPARRPNLIEMTPSEFTVWTTELRETAYTERDKLHGPALIALEDKITDMTRQLANPEEALAQQHAIIISLEEKLRGFGNDIGGDRVAEAKAALKAGDYSIAGDIFAEIEARNALAVQETARAAFGQGEVAEAQVRWVEAYTHYKRAVALHETTDHLVSYAHMTWRLAKGDEAVAAQNKLAASTKNEFGDKSPEYATQLNNLALTVKARGRYAEAEDIYREAMKIDADTIGTAHTYYATRLNNLAGVVKDQGRYGEAEELSREALKIDADAIGTAHPDYADRLNNLASAVNAQGRYVEAEGLYREAMKIDADTIGTAHPDYAKDLNNLGVNMAYQKKFTEARDLLEQALVIQKATLPADHPDIAVTEGSIAGVIAAAK